jgi:uncharacterized protein
VKPFRALALDGGGMRGLYTAEILEALSRRFANGRVAQPDVGRGFDLIVGTSTGGILACALAAGVPIGTIVQIYRDEGNEIFKHSMPASAMSLGRFAATHLFAPINDGAGLRAALTGAFGEKTIGDVYAARGIPFCLQATELSTHAPVVFRSGHLAERGGDDSTTLVDACLASSAAPILFPPARVDVGGEARVMVDGSLWANAPIIQAAIEALALCGDRPIEIVSAGTCPPPVETFAARDAQWGFMRWAFGFRVVEAGMNAQVNAAVYQFDELRMHFRVPATLIRLRQDPQPDEYRRYIGLDRADPNAIDAMEELAQRDADAIFNDASQPGSESAVLGDIFGNLPERSSA